MDINSDGSAPCVVELRGRFDANECDEFGLFIDGLRTAGVVNLNVDLSEVDFIDSTALASLVALARWATANSHVFELCNLSDPVRVIIEITGLDRAFVIRYSPTSASK